MNELNEKGFYLPFVHKRINLGRILVFVLAGILIYVLFFKKK